MKVFWNSLVVVGAIVAIGSPAQAAQITFSLVGPKTSAKIFNYSDSSGLNLAVTAFGQTINQDVAGLGVTGNGKADINDGEKLLFQFTKSVELVNAVFSNIDSNDQYTLWTGNTLDSLIKQIKVGTFSGNGELIARFGDVSIPDKTAKIFQFSTVDPTEFAPTDDYRLKSITVDDGKPTAVPTPAMLPGLVGLGLGVLRRRIAA
jgi:hypothetical protein